MKQTLLDMKQTALTRVKSYLLLGEPGVGKTTALKKIINGLGPERCGGFYTEGLYAAGDTYWIVTLNAEMGLLADVCQSTSPYRVGQYGVVLQALESFGLDAVSYALSSKSFVVIDEIGPMHLCSSLFQFVIADVLTSSVPLVATISSASHPFLDELKLRSDIEILELTRENRDEIPATVVQALR